MLSFATSRFTASRRSCQSSAFHPFQSSLKISLILALTSPKIEKKLLDGGKAASHSREEHAKMKKDLYDLDMMNVEDDGFESKLEKIMDELLGSYYSLILLFSFY